MNDFDRQPGAIDDPGMKGGLEPELDTLPPGSSADDTGTPGEPEASELDLPGPDDGFIADTPGLREIGPWDVPPEDLDFCFVEFRPYLGRCRFGNCLHRGEAGCAVRPAVASGGIDPARYDSYLRLVTEGQT